MRSFIMIVAARYPVNILQFYGLGRVYANGIKYANQDFEVNFNFFLHASCTWHNCLFLSPTTNPALFVLPVLSGCSLPMQFIYLFINITHTDRHTYMGPFVKIVWHISLRFKNNIYAVSSEAQHKQNFDFGLLTLEYQRCKRRTNGRNREREREG